MKIIYRISFLVIFLCFLGRSYANLSGYSYYKTLTIQSPMVSGLANHINFPVLISHTDLDLRSTTNGGNVQNINGFDIAFSDATGTIQLNHQIEEYDPITGTISIWVQVPSLSTSTNTDIRIYYGNATVATDQSTTNTWDTNFKAVYHLNNDLNDGTSTGSNLTDVSTTSSPGKIENGRKFITGNSLYSVPNPSLQITGDLTLSTWVKINTLQGGLKENCLINYGDFGDQPFENTLYYFNILSTGQLNMFWEDGPGFDYAMTTTNTIALSGQYSLLSVTRNSSTKELYFYQNGVLIEGPISYSYNPNNGSSSYLRLGQSQENTFDDFVGELDEVRISNNIRSQDWLITSYNTMNDPSNFYSIGPEVLLCNPPVITTCQNNLSVNANVSCNYTLADFTGTVSATDNCGFGLTKTQVPAPNSVLSPGVYQIKIYVEDVINQKDSCEFTLTVLSTVNPTIVSCGDIFTAETTQGSGDNGNSFSCGSSSTPGEDIYYQITVPTGNYQINIKLTNASDVNDNQINTYWLGSNCPSTGTCIQEYLFDIGNGKFTVNNSNNIIVYATGPGTYYFVVDSETDHIDNYDIEFNCLQSGIEFDDTNCGFDTDNDGVYAEVNGSNILTVEPCQNVTISHTIYINNDNNAEWLDSVNLQLGSCYTNINNSTLTPNLPTLNTGFYNTNGEWSATYDNSTNSIDWAFTHSNPTPQWGDGVGSQYSCYAYTFSFDATISSTCAQNSDLNIFINVSDDGVASGGASVPGFDYALSSDFILNIPDVGWSYFPDNNFCKSEANPTPIVNVLGGTFSSSSGLIFANTSSGEIDLNASNVGTYNVTYSNGLCPNDSTLQIIIYPEDNPTFSYPDTLFCQGGGNTSPNIQGTTGGIFSSLTGAIFVDNLTGEIDVNSSPTGNHLITYTTAGPNCPNYSNFQLTIAAEQFANFSYPTQNYCQGGVNPTPSITGTGGGFFYNSTGVVFADSLTGVILIDSSSVGIHPIKYYTPGPNCIDSSIFIINIHPEDNAGFNYSSTSFCKGDTNPTPNITGTSGGTFSNLTGVVFVDNTTGEIDLNLTPSGTHTITYTTPSLICPKDSSINITIIDEQIANFTYPNNSFCQRESNPFPNMQNSTLGGSFTNTTGIIFIDTFTGEIDLLNSALGTHAITYTTPGPNCINSNIFTITILQEDTAQINYPLSIYCSSANGAIPSITGAQGGTFSNNSGVSFINDLTGEIDIQNSSVGQHIIYYTTPSTNCPFTTTDTIVIQSVDNPLFIYNDTAFCITDNNPTPTIYGTQGGTFYNYSGIEFIDSVTGEINLIQSDLGYHNIIYVTPDTLCSDTLEITILILAPQTANAGNDQNLIFNFETYLEGNEALNGIGTWSGNGSYNIENVNDPYTQVSNLQLGANILIWEIDDQVCPVSIDSVTITIKDLIVPQIITPNNDGKNDYLFIKNIDLFNNSIEIYNRWGQLVYTIDNYQNDWEGIDESGNQLMNDTYFYIIKIEGSKLYKGFIVIKR
jgi:gliding motility-associated-like protein